MSIKSAAPLITISLRDDNGDVVMARQVSTRPEKIQEFFQRLTRERLQSGELFVAVLEVCGFNDWLIRMLRDYRAVCLTGANVASLGPPSWLRSVGETPAP